MMNNPAALKTFLNSFANVATGVAVFWNIVGLFYILGFVLYALFSILVVRQVYMMTSTFKTSAELPLKILSFLHLIFAIGLIFFAYTVLF